jgi:hypothetical protein
LAETVTVSQLAMNNALDATYDKALTEHNITRLAGFKMGITSMMNVIGISKKKIAAEDKQLVEKFDECERVLDEEDKKLLTSLGDTGLAAAA